MESKEFKWTPDLFKEFANYAIPESNALNFSFEKCVEQFKASKERKPLFRDFLGNDIFEREEYFSVRTVNDNYPSWYIEKLVANPHSATGKPLDGFVDFKNKSDAETYIAEHAKLYSVKDVREVLEELDYKPIPKSVIISELQKKKS